MELLLRAAETKNFSVVVTEARPECAGYAMAQKLVQHSIPVSIVLDSGVGAIMDRVDVVVVGAEGVLENGGVVSCCAPPLGGRARVLLTAVDGWRGQVNKLGTFQIALVAKAHGKPFYVAAESYKFARLFPLSQTDLPPSLLRFEPCALKSSDTFAQPPHLPPQVDTTCNPTSDLTPPGLISLLFTDLGVLTPSAVSDELIKLYQ
jgi:translation initiation factor eIF-2B subunit alpha